MAKKNYAYYRVSYSEKNDSYSTWIYVGEKKYPEWSDFGLEIECKCVKGYIEESGNVTDGTDFVSYHILRHISEAIRLGYKVSFEDRPEKG